jgi:hypothetical protein
VVACIKVTWHPSAMMTSFVTTCPEPQLVLMAMTMTMTLMMLMTAAVTLMTLMAECP